MLGMRRGYLDYASGVSGNPSSPTEEGRHAHALLENARTAIARLIETKPDDIIFTSGATESNALAILGIVRAAKKHIAHPHVLYLPSAHASVVENVQLLSAEGVAVEAVSVRDGAVDIRTFIERLRTDTVLVVMDAVCGETGVVWNTRAVAQAIADRYQEAHGRPVFHVDASQAPFSENITRAHFGADTLTFDAAKVGALRGIGILAARRTIPITPLYLGGGQERGLRPGSESPQQAKLFAEMLTIAVKKHTVFRTRAVSDRARLIDCIKKRIPDVLINEGKEQAPHILNLSLPGRDTDYLVALLDEAGFALSTRSACETNSQEGSRAVFSLFGDVERARATLRISWGPDTPRRTLFRFLSAFIRAVAFVDRAMEE